MAAMEECMSKQGEGPSPPIPLHGRVTLLALGNGAADSTRAPGGHRACNASPRFKKLMEEESRRKQLLEQAKPTEEAGIESEALDGKQSFDAFAADSNLEEESHENEPMSASTNGGLSHGLNETSVDKKHRRGRWRLGDSARRRQRAARGEQVSCLGTARECST